MQNPPELFQSLAQMATSAKRGSALSPLNWLVASLGAVAATSVWSHDRYLTYGAWGGLGVVVITYLVVYVYLILKKPDLTRSEHFTLEKMRLELLGDSKTGLEEQPIVDGQIEAQPPEQPQLPDQTK